MAALPGEPAGARIIDASLNRAAEALRVVEDIGRFHLELPGLAREIKEIRHAVLQAFAATAEERARLIRARDIEEDVGREISAGVPAGDLAALALRNLQRAKEALRCLEEVGRLSSGAAAGEAAALRYRLYSVEKGLVFLAGEGGPRRMAQARLYLIATRSLSHLPLPAAVQSAIAAGASAVQLREKGLSDREVLPMGRSLRQIALAAGVPFIVNDRPDLAAALGADGVHLGQDDLPVAAARAILGTGRIVGVSTHTVDQARRAEREGADYIGVGPVFETSTKDAGAPIGPEGLKAILDAVDLPAFAIGGIRPENVAVIAAAGCHRAAVSSGILAAGGEEQIKAAASKILEDLTKEGNDDGRRK
jgi:thiamine-phosphate pyrophosphorylase